MAHEQNPHSPSPADHAATRLAHARIERLNFYPRCEEKMGMSELLGEALVEHGLVEFSVMQADRALGEDDFEYKLTVLRETLEHHIDEEEAVMLPLAEELLSEEELRELGEQMYERKNGILAKKRHAA